MATSYVRLLLTLLVIIWSLTATVETLTLRGLTPFQLTAWSTLCGAAGTFAFLLATGNAGNLLRFRAADHIRLAILSILGFAGYYALKYLAYTSVPVPQANILQYTYPLFIVLFAIPILGQPFTATKIIGTGSGFIGAAIIFSGGRLITVDWANFWGYFAALAAGLSWGLFSVLAARFAFHPFTSLFNLNLYSSALMFALITAGGMFGAPSGWPEIGGVLYSGVASNLFGNLLWLTAQKSIGDVSLITGALYLIPFFSLFALRLFLGFPIPGAAAFGLALIIGGMVFTSFMSRSTEPRAKV
jgi:drug/metabolite transporter (DMT)-like permease